ncbi:MAG: hypothetical protein HOP08_03170 [Cyclobacteriaceae bacterium]|nr:hypothetical protein [Cyclobacteriaceae bacterium]
MKTIIKTFLFASAILLSGISQAQESESRILSSFEKIIASPRVNVILIKGDQESIRFIFNDIPESKVNAVVKGNKLRIYLDHARVTERQVRITENGHTHKRGIYAGSAVTAYVTYKELKSIEVRGEQELRCDDELTSDKFKLKAYGETEIRLASLVTKKFKASLYGENDLKIKSGTTDRQVYRLFGENKIDTRGLKSEIALTRIYGEGKISVSASDEVRVNALGEPTINVEGTSIISKRVILGRATINVN